MNYAPIARILIRYAVGATVGFSDDLGQMLAADPDLVMFVAGAIGAATEAVYAYAKRKGWAT